MENFNKERTRNVALWMYGFASVSTISAVISLIIAETRSEIDWQLTGAGIWGVTFTWPAAILAHMASQRPSPRGLLISHAVMCILAAATTFISSFLEMTFVSAVIYESFSEIKAASIMEGPRTSASTKSALSMIIISNWCLFGIFILSICSAVFTCKYVCCTKMTNKVDVEMTSTTVEITSTTVSATAPDTVATTDGTTAPTTATTTDATTEPINNALLGVQLLKNGELEYYPANSQAVSDLATNAGRMILVQLSDEPGTSSNTKAYPAYPPAYPSVDAQLFE